MRKWKKLAAWGTAVMMMCSLAGCGGKEEAGGSTGTSASGSESSAVSGETEKTVPSESGEEAADYSEHYTFSYAEISINEATDYNGDDFSKWWQEKYNFDWDIISIPQDSWAEKVRIWINSGDLPDVTVFSYNHAEMLNYIDQGLVYRFPDGWEERWPNVAKAQADSQLGTAVSESVGGTYFLARPVFSTNKPTEKTISHMCIFLRKDWAEAVDFELKDAYTVSEILDYARLIKEKDPGNVGNKLVPIANTTGNTEYFFIKSNSTYGTSGDQMFYRDTDGKIKWGPANEDTLRGLKQWKQAYEEGLINPEFYTYNGSEDGEAFYVGGTAGAVFYSGHARYIDLVKSNMENNLGISGDDSVWVAAVTADDGYYYEFPQTNYYGTVIFNPDIAQAKWERYMDMLDFSASEEGQYMIRMGFEGIDWERDSSGEIRSLLEDGVEARSKYPSIYPVFHRLLVLSDDFGMVNPSLSKESRERALELYKLKEKLDSGTSVGNVDFDLYFYSSEAKNALSFDLGNEYAALITSDKDIETAWNEWVQSYAYLIDPVLEEMNKNIP